MIEKCTELGVERIVPVRAARTERGLEQAAAKRLERWRRIGLEASQQSRRDRLPDIEEVVEFGDALRIEVTCRFACDEEPGAAGLLDAVPPRRSGNDTVALLVGPEGGWTDTERAQFLEQGWTAVSLGRQVLRAETAAVAAVAIAQAAWQVAQVV